MAGFGGLATVGTMGAEAPVARIIRLPAAGGGGAGGAGGLPMGEAGLAARRAQVDQFISQLRDMFGAQAAGQDVPFPELIARALMAQSSDAAQAGTQAEQLRIQRGFNRAMGSGTSGGQLAAEAAAARRGAAQAGQGRRDVGIRTGVENFGARERGKQALGGLLGQLMNWNSRFEVTGESPLSNAIRGQPTGSGGGGGGGIDPELARLLARGQGAGAQGFSTGWEGVDYQAPTWNPQGVYTDGGAADAARRRDAYYASVADLGNYGQGGRASGTGVGAPSGQDFGGGYPVQTGSPTRSPNSTVAWGPQYSRPAGPAPAGGTSWGTRYTDPDFWDPALLPGSSLATAPNPAPPRQPYRRS